MKNKQSCYVYIRRISREIFNFIILESRMKDEMFLINNYLAAFTKTIEVLGLGQEQFCIKIFLDFVKLADNKRKLKLICESLRFLLPKFSSENNEENKFYYGKITIVDSLRLYFSNSLFQLIVNNFGVFSAYIQNYQDRYLIESYIDQIDGSQYIDMHDLYMGSFQEESLFDYEPDQLHET